MIFRTPDKKNQCEDEKPKVYMEFRTEQWIAVDLDDFCEGAVETAEPTNEDELKKALIDEVGEDQVIDLLWDNGWLAVTDPNYPNTKHEVIIRLEPFGHFLVTHAKPIKPWDASSEEPAGTYR